MKEVLLVVDVQNDVMAHGWKRDLVIDNIKTLVNRARMKNIPVVWVQHEDPYLVRDSLAWRIVDELTPLDTETRIFKQWGDAFVETNLQSVLVSLEADTIVLVGAQTDACIRMTLYGSIYRGYHVILIEDAHTTDEYNFRDKKFTGELVVSWYNHIFSGTALPQAEVTLSSTEKCWTK